MSGTANGWFSKKRAKLMQENFSAALCVFRVPSPNRVGAPLLAVYHKDDATPAWDSRRFVKIKLTLSGRQDKLRVATLSRHAEKACAALCKDDLSSIAPRGAASRKGRGHMADNGPPGPCDGRPHQAT